MLHVGVTALALTSWLIKGKPSDRPAFPLEKWVWWLSA